MTIKAILIDVDTPSVQLFQSFLQKFPQIELLEIFNDPIKALHMIESNPIDIIFLEINLPKLSGLNFIESLQTKPEIVIITECREYAVESYNLDVLDYLVKPISFNRFMKTVNKITQRVYSQRGNKKDNDTNNESYIFLKVDKKLVKIKFEDILYIESLKDYIKIFTTIGDYLVHSSLTGITEELPKDNFIRIHRSYTIAIDKVVSIEGNLVEIKSKRIPIGRKYVNHAKRVILNA